MVFSGLYSDDRNRISGTDIVCAASRLTASAKLAHTMYAGSFFCLLPCFALPGVSTASGVVREDVNPFLSSVRPR